MQEQINELQKTSKQTANDVKEIKDFLIGNEFLDNGLINRVKTMEDYQSRDKKQKWMIAGGVSVLALLREFGKDFLNFVTS